MSSFEKVNLSYTRDRRQINLKCAHAKSKPKDSPSWIGNRKTRKILLLRVQEIGQFNGVGELLVALLFDYFGLASERVTKFLAHDFRPQKSENAKT